MEFLYYLQTIRQGCPDWVITVIILFSESVLIVAPVIPCCIYWSVDKKKGTYMACALAVALLVNELLKVTFCVYRPWILDSRIIPVEQVLNTATNYSFPSSHSCAVAVTCTSNLLASRKSKVKTVVSILFVLMVMFARMFLGCHTLKDVCVGAAVGVCAAFIMSPLLKDTFDEDKFTKWLLPVALVVTTLSLVYIINKSYPMDYNADGSLVVDPVQMRPDVIGSCGLFAGVGIGLFLERKFVKFSMPGDKKRAVLRSVVGVIVFALLYLVILKKLFGGLDPSLYKFLRFSLCAIIMIVVYPMLFKLDIWTK